MDGVRIPLRNKRGEVVAYALVDKQDAHHARHRWHRNTGGYAARHVVKDGVVTLFLLHRDILGLVKGDGLHTDHINRDKLDNRRANLRLVTHAENQQNRGGWGVSSFRGVTWDERAGKWRARSQANGRRVTHGMFVREADAAAAAAEFRAHHMPFSAEALAA